jgi:hypothetical protein
MTFGIVCRKFQKLGLLSIWSLVKVFILYYMGWNSVY